MKYASKDLEVVMNTSTIVHESVTIEILKSRLTRKWEMRRALTTPSRGYQKLVSGFGLSMTVPQWIEFSGCSNGAFHGRYTTMGMSLEDTFTVTGTRGRLTTSEEFKLFLTSKGY